MATIKLLRECNAVQALIDDCEAVKTAIVSDIVLMSKCIANMDAKNVDCKREISYIWKTLNKTYEALDNHTSIFIHNYLRDEQARIELNLLGKGHTCSELANILTKVPKYRNLLKCSELYWIERLLKEFVMDHAEQMRQTYYKLKLDLHLRPIGAIIENLTPATTDVQAPDKPYTLEAKRFVKKPQQLDDTEDDDEWQTPKHTYHKTHK